MKNKNISRRRFLKIGALSTTGFSSAFWIGKSNSFPARFVRDRWAESGREIVTPAFKPVPNQWSDNTITASWLGHSTVLINFFGVSILTDPVLFKRVGANLGIGTLGPKRMTASALSANELPAVDLVLLSHAHLDHFDFPSLTHFNSDTKVVSAAKTLDLLAETELSSPEGLRWGQKTTVSTKNGALAIEAFEVNHWGGRWSHKEDRGWNGYILSREGKKIIFGGDTAQCDNFKNIRSKGPFEIALMPIGAYNPWIRAHCTPEEAVEMSNNAGAKYIIPIHHQTFCLGREPFKEPIERFEAALQKENERMALRGVGETFVLS